MARLKLSSPRMELAALRGMTSRDRVIHSVLLTGVDESYFSSDEAREAYSHIKTQVQEDGKPPTFRVLCEDPAISSSARDFLRDSPNIVGTKQDARKVLRNLNGYRQRRILTNLVVETHDNLQGKTVDVDAIKQNLSESLAELNGRSSSKNLITTFGKGSTSKKVLNELLHGDRTANVIPTGIETFDSVNGGVIRGSLFTIGGNSGGGKSQLASSLAVNFASTGYKVVLVPLEMSELEMAARIVANIAKIDSKRLMLGQLTKREKILVAKRVAKWEKRTARKGGAYHIYKPDTDVSIDEVYAVVDAMNPDVCIVDYVTLLKVDDNHDQWRQLGHVARVGKINAENNNRVNILLCQINDDGTVRYSRAINEHSSLSWVFLATEETKQQGILPIDQPKARNQEQFPFTVGIDYSQSRVYDLDGGGRDSFSARGSDDTELPNLASGADV